MLRTILVDDEKAARDFLAGMLEEYDNIQLVGQASDGLAAISEINRLNPDLVFLDIQMPVLSGLEILPYLETRPMIVFISAYDKFAIEAFSSQAIDYLLKPVEPQRLAQTINRLSNEWKKIEILKLTHVMSKGLKKIVCKKNQVFHVVWLHEIALFTKEGRYTKVLLNNDSIFFSDFSLDYLSKEIRDPDFFRLSRSSLIHRDYVKSFKVESHAKGSVCCQNGAPFRISRSRLQAFKIWFLASS